MGLLILGIIVGAFLFWSWTKSPERKAYERAAYGTGLAPQERFRRQVQARYKQAVKEAYTMNGGKAGNEMMLGLLVDNAISSVYKEFNDKIISGSPSLPQNISTTELRRIILDEKDKIIRQIT